MFFQTDLTAQFAAGAATGLGSTFGRSFIPWVIKSWNWLWGRKPAEPENQALAISTSNTDSLLRKVTLNEVSAGIPEGFQLCRFKGNSLQEKYLSTLPDAVAPDESLWLVPTGEVLVIAGFPAGESSGEAEIAVEFDPDQGLASLLAEDHDLNRGWLGALVAGSLVGVMSSLGKQSGTALASGDPAATDGCRQRLDQALQQRGLRCRKLRSIRESQSTEAINTAGDATFTELAQEVSQVRNASDWDKLVGSLKGAGVPVDAATTKQLDQIRDDVIRKAINPNQAVTGLARLTAEAFERAGIQEPDLRSWQNLSERLSTVDAPDTAGPASEYAAVGVAGHKRPSTWCVWSRQEVDRRLLQFTRRTVRNCKVACDQALASLREIAPLRQVRDFNTQLTMIEELLATMPPLDPRTASLKIDAHTAKTLVKSLEEAVLVTESLSKQADLLFSQATSTPAWNDAMHQCMRSVTKLAQLVRDRRTVR